MIATDLLEKHCGYPTSLQTCLRGKPMVNPRDRHKWALGLAEATASLAAIPLDSTNAAELTSFKPWWPASTKPPERAMSASRWRTVAESLKQQLPRHSEYRLVHRDLHPPNVLFWRNTWSATVDRVSGGLGPTEVDVSRCRVQIAFLTARDTADLYLDACRAQLITDDYDARDALVAIELSPRAADRRGVPRVWLIGHAQ
jgi:aminoglycoside phosphotransferase (APT) family kinase protein